jgi:hypothetical protein
MKMYSDLVYRSLAAVITVTVTLYIVLSYHLYLPWRTKLTLDEYRQRPECQCVRPALRAQSFPLSYSVGDDQKHLCSRYATHRGPHQRVISISLFGPKENQLFQLNRSLVYLHQLVNDLNKIYPDDFILRIYHDDTIDASTVVCSVECEHPNVDFCFITEKRFIPSKIWRFIPAGDILVDISKHSVRFISDQSSSMIQSEL